MKVSACKPKVNFNGITKIYTKNPQLLNFLNDVDYKVWSKSQNPKFKFDCPAQDRGKNGFFSGVLFDGDDVFTHNRSNSNVKEVIISTKEELFNLPAFKKIKNVLKEQYNKLVK
jgi:hypothetical protein